MTVCSDKLQTECVKLSYISVKYQVPISVRT